MIRKYQKTDGQQIKDIFAKQGLPEQCYPDLSSKTFLIKKVVEGPERKIAMAGFVRKTCEPFLILDHSIGDPGVAVECFTGIVGKHSWVRKGSGNGRLHHLDSPHLVDSFGPRLEALGFIKSPWQSFTKKL